MRVRRTTNKTMISPEAARLIIRHFDVIDQAVSARTARKRPWLEVAITSYLCLAAAERGAMEDLDSDDRFMFATVFTKTLRYSVLVTAHILLETSLEAICDAEQRRFGYRLRLKDLTGSGVERAKLYLAKVCGVRFPDGTAEWNRMAILSEIRNVIVHADGDVSKARHERSVRNTVRNTGGLSLRHDRYLEVADAFIRHTMLKMKTFAAQVHRAFPPKLRAT
jgi:hypothetical protein